jgi:hypothetical protein
VLFLLAKKSQYRKNHCGLNEAFYTVEKKVDHFLEKAYIEGKISPPSRLYKKKLQETESLYKKALVFVKTKTLH